MCTAVSFVTKDHYFGRNLDFEFSYEESVTITPRNFEFSFRNQKELMNPWNRKDGNGNGHYAMIGVAYVVDNYPLYYDAVNEAGLAMAGLLFAGNAVYCSEKEPADECSNVSSKDECLEEKEKKEQVASFEFIPWILGQCRSVDGAKEVLERVRIMNWAFSKELPPSPLHWIIADKRNTIVVEAVKEGLKVYDNPVHVLTNNPGFPYHMMNLNNYMAVSPYEPENSFAKGIELSAYSRGMGGIGLPGDLSSTSRFVKAAFTRMNSICSESEEGSVSHFFHILESVYQQRGCVRLLDDNENETEEKLWEKQPADKRVKYEVTIYSGCCNVSRGIYYYKTYENSQITAVDMYKENLEGNMLISYPLLKEMQIKWQN